MTLTTHATMGAVIGHATGNPLAAFVIGFIVHLLVDAIVAMTLVMILFNVKDIVSIREFTWGIVGSVLPDMLVGLYDLTKSRFLKWFFDLHFFFHDYFVKKRGDVPLYYALLAQIVLIAYLQTKL